MKPLIATIVTTCLLLAINALPENKEDAKTLPQTKEPVVEAEESEPQNRKERCTTCSGGFNLNIPSPNQVLAQIQAQPGTEIHTQQSFEGCSSDKGCAGIKVKDGRVIERFGNVDSFKQAAASDAGNEFTFHAAGSLANVFEGGIPNEGPFWWMNQNSPFKAGAGGAAGASGSGGSFEKFSKSSSSFSSTGGTGGLGAGGLAAGGAGAGQGASFGASLDLSGNPFLNGEFSKIAGGFAGGQEVKPAGFQSSSFESSSFSTSNNAEVDAAKNQFGGANKFGGSGFQAQGGFAAGGGQNAFGAGQNGGFGAGGSQAGFQGSKSSNSFSASSQGGYGNSGSQNGFGANNGFGGSSGQAGFAAGSQGQGFQNQGFASGNKFSSSGYTGSSPSPFTASTAGSNVNLIQNTQKTSEFDFEQQQQTQQNIDEVFQGTGNVHAHEHSGGDLQQTCAGQGYVCVHKAQCNNGVVNTNGVGIHQARTTVSF